MTYAPARGNEPEVRGGTVIAQPLQPLATADRCASLGTLREGSMGNSFSSRACGPSRYSGLGRWPAGSLPQQHRPNFVAFVNTGSATRTSLGPYLGRLADSFDISAAPAARKVAQSEILAREIRELVSRLVGTVSNRLEDAVISYRQVVSQIEPAKLRAVNQLRQQLETRLSRVHVSAFTRGRQRNGDEWPRSANARPGSRRLIDSRPQVASWRERARRTPRACL